MKTKRLQHPISVRFPVEIAERVEQFSRTFNLPASDLIRQSLAMTIPIWERDGIKLVAIRKSESAARRTVGVVP